jgi:glutamate-1-semialdehyde 2,1-aminomutase
LPLSVLAGKNEYMGLISRGEVVHAGSLNGSPLILSGAKAALEELRNGEKTIYPRMRRLGEQLAAGLVENLRKIGLRAVSTGDGPVFTIHVQTDTPRNYRDTIASDKQIWSDFVLSLLDEGVVILPDARWYISAAHSKEDIEATLAAVQRAAKTIGPRT